VRNGDDRSGSGSSSNAEQPSPSSIQKVRTTRTSRLRAAVTSGTGIYVLTLPSVLYGVAVLPYLAFLNSGSLVMCRKAGFLASERPELMFSVIMPGHTLLTYFIMLPFFTENNIQSGKDSSGIPFRNVRNTGSASPRTAVSKDVLHCVTPSLSGKDLINESSVLSPRKDMLILARSQSGKDLVRDSPELSFKSRDPRDAARLYLSRSHSGKDLIRDLSLSPRCSTRDSGSHLSRAQSGKELGSTGLSPRRQSGRELFGLSSRPLSAKDPYEGENPSRSLASSPRTRRVGVTDRQGPTPITGATGSSEKEVSSNPHSGSLLV